MEPRYTDYTWKAVIGMIISEIIEPSLVVLKKGCNVKSAVKELVENRLVGAPVVNDGRVEGVLLLIDALNFPGDTSVEKAMRTDFPRLKVTDPVEKVTFGLLPVYPVTDNEGSLEGVITENSINNILQKSLRLSRHRTEVILEYTHNGILAIDIDGYVTACNSSAGRLLGMRQEDIVGRPVNDLFPMDKCILPRVMETGRPEYSRKIVINGRTMVSNNTPILIEGEIVGAVAVFQDITDLERVSSELDSVRHLYKQLDSVIESSFDGIMLTDSRGRGIRINRALARLTGLDESYFVGKPIDDLFRKGIFRCESVTIKALQEGRTVTAVQYIIPTGKEVLVTGNPIFDSEGRISLVLTNVRDVTELNQLKEKLRESQMLTARYHAELSQLLVEKLRHDKVIARSKEMIEVLNIAVRVAQTDSTVLIAGESGVGKEVVARVIHNESERSKHGNLIQINCGAIPENLLEAELFGYEPGSFTGASKQGKLGLFELAHKGTILLDEIADLPLNLQVKLLRVLQEQEVYRIGGVRPIRLDVRVIAATNKDLWSCVQQGTFREDLFYRINVVPITVPPLRERKEDIIPLALHFLKLFNEKYGAGKKLDSGAMSVLELYNWPGNVRELENLIERIGILCEDGLIGSRQLRDQLYRNEKKTLQPIMVNSLMPLKDAQEILEKELLNTALNRFKTTRKAAEVLGIAHSSVVRKAAKYKLKSVQQWTKTLGNEH